MCIKININFNKFYIFGSVTSNSQSITLSDCHAAACLAYQMIFRNADKFKGDY